MTTDVAPGYRMALLDWLACACAGRGERAARAARAAGTDLVANIGWVATAGHVLDYDDTLPDGVAHVSATTAPVALVVAAARGQSLGEALIAYAEGYEATATVAAASHPSLYDGGWHPTAVCGPIGSAVTASRLLGLTTVQRDHAVAISLLRAGGTRGAFGSDGKAIQVGLAAAAGVQAALMAQAGAVVDVRAIDGPVGFAAVLGATWPWSGGAPPEPGLQTAPAITRNWIKLHPSCLGTHAPIDAAEQLRSDAAVPDGPVEVVVHPVARQAAHLDTVGDGLAAKFSIPYCVAHTIVRGAPRTSDFVQLDADIAHRASSVTVTVDSSLPQWGTVLKLGGRELVRLPGPRGAPGRPVTDAELWRKVSDLAGDRLSGVLDDLRAPAVVALHAAGLD